MMPSGRELRASVIVIGYAPAPLLSRCLAELRRQVQGRGDVEIIVAAHASHQGSSFAPVRDEFREFQWLDAPADHNVARLRGLGVARSDAPLVALLEGDCVPAAGWIERLVHLDPVGGVGGSIEPGAFPRAVDWAAYFCEFAPYMAPVPSAPPQLPGTNVVYRRSALPEAARLEAEGFYETFVNETLGDKALAGDSEMVVRHERAWNTTDALATRFHHGRAFGALRTRGAPLWRRAPYVALAIALPVVLVARVYGEVLRRGRFVGRLIRVTPWIVALSLSWALGELAGYAAGAGTSLDRWR